MLRSDIEERDNKIREAYAKLGKARAVALQFDLSECRIGQILNGGALRYCVACRERLTNRTAFNTRKCFSCREKDVAYERQKKHAYIANREQIRKAKVEQILLRAEKKRKDNQDALDFNNALVSQMCPGCKKDSKQKRKEWKKRKYCADCWFRFKEFQGRERTREIRRTMDNHTCQDCGKVWIPRTRRFDIHHLGDLCGKLSRKYDRVENLDGLITLCHKCHMSKHVSKEKFAKQLSPKEQARRTEAIKALRKVGKTQAEISAFLGVSETTVYRS